MIITKEIILFLYEFVDKKEFDESLYYFEDKIKDLNIDTYEFVINIKNIIKKNLISQSKDKDLNLDDELIKNLLDLFLKKYKIIDDYRCNFVLSLYSIEEMSRIKSIELNNYYLSCASSHLRLYKKEECNEYNKFLLYFNKGKYIDLYELNIKYDLDECYITDILDFGNNQIIVLFINLIFLFKIENDNLIMVKFIKEKYKLIRCHKYGKSNILVGSEGNMVIYEIKNGNYFQKIVKYDFGNGFRQNYYYFFDKMIIVNNMSFFQIFTYNKIFKLNKLKNDYIISKYKRILICYIKKINKFVLEEFGIGKHKLILTDFDKIYDEIILPEQVVNIQEYSNNDEFIVLLFLSFNKYKIENDKIKLVFSTQIKKKDALQDIFHIMEIPGDKYILTGMNGYMIYKWDKNDEINDVNGDND